MPGLNVDSGCEYAYVIPTYATDYLFGSLAQFV